MDDKNPKIPSDSTVHFTETGRSMCVHSKRIYESYWTDIYGETEGSSLYTAMNLTDVAGCERERLGAPKQYESAAISNDAIHSWQKFRAVSGE